MFTLEISGLDVKSFMNRLLRDIVFDEFEVRGIELVSFTKFEISGILSKEKPQAGDGRTQTVTGRNYCTWAELRQIVFQTIKSGNKPHSLKIVFALPSKMTENFHPNAAALFFNLYYDGSSIICTTATSPKNFVLDRTMDNMWEDYIKGFCLNNGLLAVIGDEC